ncbi:hypothetical protein [Pandoraea sputorum]|uniref:hypothetical protein n=1 Tax=Pandoraea sputorum TaxID=93222 RepID=UPI002F403528
MEILIWAALIALNVLCGLYAANKGRRRWLWTVVAFIVSPFLTWIVLLFLKDIRSGDDVGKVAKHSAPNRWLLAFASLSCLLAVIGLVGMSKGNQQESGSPTNQAESAAESQDSTTAASPGSSVKSTEKSTPSASDLAKQIKPETLVRFPKSSLACMSKDDLQEAMTYGTNGQETKMRAMMLSKENPDGTCIMLPSNESYKVISAEYNVPDMPEMGLLEIVGKSVTVKNGLWTFSWVAEPVKR